jgi:uncharacterized membrane protein (DUF2068 family)
MTEFTALDPYSAPLAAPSGQARRPFGLKAIMFLLTFRLLGQGVLMTLVVAVHNSDALDLTWTELALFVSDGFQWLLMLITLIGLWRLRRWAWYLLMALFAFSMTVDIVLYFSGQPPYLSMLLNVIMVFYVNQREVRQLFVGLAGRR